MQSIRCFFTSLALIQFKLFQFSFAFAHGVLVGVCRCLACIAIWFKMSAPLPKAKCWHCFYFLWSFFSSINHFYLPRSLIHSLAVLCPMALFLLVLLLLLHISWIIFTWMCEHFVYLCVKFTQSATRHGTTWSSLLWGIHSLSHEWNNDK